MQFSIQNRRGSKVRIGRRNHRIDWLEPLEIRDMLSSTGAVAINGRPTHLVSDDSGLFGNGDSDAPRISANGRYVVFSSFASNLVPGDTNNSSDIFVRNLQTGVTTLVSVPSSGSTANGHSYHPSISADGRFIVFESHASNLVSGDTNRTPDVFLRDMQARSTTRISVDSFGIQGSSNSIDPVISADGRFVAFASYSRNWLGTDTGGSQIWIRDIRARTTTLVTKGTDGLPGNDSSYRPTISDNGRYVGFYSFATNLIGSDRNGATDVFVRDTQAQTTSRVSVNFNGSESNGDSFSAAISGNGEHVAFVSTASNLVAGDTNVVQDIFLRNMKTNTTKRISVNSNGIQSNGFSRDPSISQDGRYVIYVSSATNLDLSIIDSNGKNDIFLYDGALNRTRIVSVNVNGTQANNASFLPAIDGLGRQITYVSLATNLDLSRIDNSAFSDVFTVGNPNVPPVISGFAGTVSYTEGAAPVQIDSDVTIGDEDSPDFNNGTLTVSIEINKQATDILSIVNMGSGSTQVITNGTNVSVGGIVIGTFSGGTNNNPLSVSLNANSTPARLQSLLRSIGFASVSENPSVLDRTIRVTLTDGDGGISNLPTKLVKVVAINDAPVIGAFDGSVTYTEGAAPVLIDNTATVVDVDSANFAGGKLTVALSANGQSTDRIGIKHVGNLAGQIGVSGTAVSYGGVAIGTFAGTTSLVVTLNDKATPLAVQALLRSVTFASLSENPSVLDRTIKVTLTDGDGGTSNLPTKTIRVIAVNDAPVIAAFDTAVTYVENSAPVVLDANAMIGDLDSANFAGGKLTVAVSANSQTTDRIGIKHVGSLAGQIGVFGTTVRYGGVAIGTFAGTTSLVVTLNDKATPAAVQALLRSVTFASLSENPSVLARTIKVTVTDGDGGTSNLATKLVKVVAVNDAPVIGAFDTAVTYIAKGTPVVIDTNATVTDVDSVNLNSGVLTVGVIAGGQVTDRIDIRHQGTGAGQIGVSGLNVTYGGTIIGSFSGTTSLKVIFKAAATPAAVQALLRNITFCSTSVTPSTTNRTIKVTLMDGDGGTSNQPVKTVKVSAVSPAAPRSPRSSLSFDDLDLSFEMGLVESDLLTVG